MNKRLLVVAALSAVAFAAAVGTRSALDWHRSCLHRAYVTRFEKVQKGMTREQVEAIMGPPSGKPHEIHVFNADFREIRWALFWYDGQGGFEVTFSSDDGLVIEKDVPKLDEDSFFDWCAGRLRGLLSW